MDYNLERKKGDVYLERHIGELRQLSYEFHRMSDEMSSIGKVIDDMIKHYYELEDSIKSGENIEVTRKVIEENSIFVMVVLTNINSKFGENKKLWYGELSGFQTETQKEVWEKFKEFETKKSNIIIFTNGSKIDNFYLSLLNRCKFV